MSEERICYRCLLIESGKDDIFEDIKRRIEKISLSEKTEDTEYNRRIELCRECDYLSEGTCLKCGCYPEFRSAFKKNRCPVCLVRQLVVQDSHFGGIGGL